MSEQLQGDAAFFFGVMVLKDGKWTPHSKHDGGLFGSALISAEELDRGNEFDGVKVMKISLDKSSGVEPKEAWISPRFAARAKAAAEAKLRAGVKETQEHLAAVRRGDAKTK